MPRLRSRVGPTRFASSVKQARARLSHFRRGGQLAVSTTGILILIGEVPAETVSEASGSVQEATTILQDLLSSAYEFLPKILIATFVLAIFWFLNRVLRRILRKSKKAKNIEPLAQIFLYFLALVIMISILAGDARALLGSLGLVGLALSWSLQTPIESFTGWILNTFRSHYRVGDRIRVGEVFGDVYQIDYLTTTIWEAGGPGKAVTGAQPTGALVTFPNNEILRSNIVNYTREFPFVWDEVVFGISNDSDLSYAVETIRKKADNIIGAQMISSIDVYRGLLTNHGLSFDVEEKPQVYLSLTDSWTNCTVRYLVDARSRRKWSSRLIELISEEISLPRHRGRIFGGFPRQVVQLDSGETLDRAASTLS